MYVAALVESRIIISRMEASSMASTPTKPDASLVTFQTTIRGKDRCWLEELSASVKSTTGSFVGMRAILRACVAGVRRSGLDLSSCESEAEMETRIRMAIASSNLEDE